jgi:hypothetical protein
MLEVELRRSRKSLEHRLNLGRIPDLYCCGEYLVPYPANKDRKSYAAAADGFASSIWHLAMILATDFEVHLNG